MLRIAFQKKRFTLWEIIDEKRFKDVNGVFIPYRHIEAVFVQNLSNSYKKSVKLAFLKGCKDARVFKGVEILKTDDFVRLGAYKGIKIKNVNDAEFLFWYYMETFSEKAKKILISEFGYSEFKGLLIIK